MLQKKSVNLSAKLSTVEYNIFRESCEIWGVSMSSFIREAIMLRIAEVNKDERFKEFLSVLSESVRLEKEELIRTYKLKKATYVMNTIEKSRNIGTVAGIKNIDASIELARNMGWKDIQDALIMEKRGKEDGKKKEEHQEEE